MMTFDCGYDYVYDDENDRIILFIIYEVHLTAQGKSSLGLKHVVFVIVLVFIFCFRIIIAPKT